MADTKRIPPQSQERQPGMEHEMQPTPEFIRKDYKGTGKLQDKVAVITGADSGIGRAVAVHFAREGADVCVMYLDEHKDAEETKQLVESEGRKCTTIAGDIGDHQFCKDSINHVAKQLGKIDILVNNAGEQHFVQDIKHISPQQLERTFRTNIFSMFYLTQAALDHMAPGSCIINTTSITAYKGHPQLLDYSSTKGAIVSFTCSLALMQVERQIRVNAVAPGPIWTPLIPATFPPEVVEQWKESCPMKRPAHPSEVAQGASLGTTPSKLRVPRFGGQHLLFRPSAPPKWWHSGERMSAYSARSRQLC